MDSKNSGSMLNSPFYLYIEILLKMVAELNKDDFDVKTISNLFGYYRKIGFAQAFARAPKEHIF